MHRSSGRSRRTVFGFAAALLALGLVAAACGSDDSSSGSGTTAGGGAGTTATGGAGTTAASTETPVAGGKLVVGIEADTGSPWTPAKILCAAVVLPDDRQSCYDPLVVGQRGRQGGALSRRVDHAQRRLHGLDDQGALRHHVPRRHAVRRGRDRRTTSSARRSRSSPRKVVSDIATNPDGSPQIVVTDPMTVTITMKRSWVVFPIYLAGQLGLHRRARRG